MRRALSWLATLLVALAALVGLIAVINSRDEGEVGAGDRNRPASSRGPGEPYRGDPVLSPALEDAVRRGNIVVLHKAEEPPEGTADLVPPGGKALEAAGQSVVIEREPTLAAPLAAVSQRRIEQADRPEELQPFVDYWLGGR